MKYYIGNYELIEKNDKKHYVYNQKEYDFIFKINPSLCYKWITTTCFKIRKTNGKSIVLLYLKNKK